MPATTQQPTIAELSERYQCSKRTLQRWKARGVNIHDISEVTDHILANSGQRLACVAAIGLAFQEHLASQPTALEELHQAFRDAMTPSEP